jgi:hypothetical protein
MGEEKYNKEYGDYMVRDEHGNPLYDSRFEPAMRRDWREYNPDYDINLAAILKSIDIDDEMDFKKGPSEIEISMNMFSDENIDQTVIKYNHDYGRLIRMLTIFIDSETLQDYLYDINADALGFLNPSKDLFEELRQLVVNNKRKGL